MNWRPLLICLIAALAFFPFCGQGGAKALRYGVMGQPGGDEVRSEEPLPKVPYRVASQMWPAELGHQRAVVHVEEKSDAVRVFLPWRRRDPDVEKKDIIVVDLSTGQRVQNAAVIRADRESADLAFQPTTAPGEYGVYFLPYRVQMTWGGYWGDYTPRVDTADNQWKVRNGLTPPRESPGLWRELPTASVLAFESRTSFDSVYPMEVVATGREVVPFLYAHPEPYLVFSEDRAYPIRMTDDLPLRWIERGPSREFRGEAQRNEFYAFQIGLYAARRPLKDISLKFTELRPTGRGKALPASAFRCFNLGGVDTDGQPFQKTLSVPQGKVQALWVGVDMPQDAAADDYRSTITVQPSNAPPTDVSLFLKVLPDVLADRGDSEPWRHSRLRWLDSTAGIDDEVVAPYTPLQVKGRSIRCLGREVRFGADGFLESIRSGGGEILATPLRLVAETDAGILDFRGRAARVTRRTPGAVTWESERSGGQCKMAVRATMEFDGHIQYWVTLHADQEMKVNDIRLELPLRREAATYMMGIGRKGGYRPKEYAWKWGGPQDSFWIGDVWGGVHCELRGGSYHGPMLNLYHPAPPPSWHNDGRGGCTVREGSNGLVVATAYSGERHLTPGQPLALEFALLVTPVKPLDTARHFRERYYHSGGQPTPGEDAVAAGVNVINLHHANEFNPYINYPFLAVDRMAAFVNTWHARGIKVKIYYTVRELSNHVVEMWALRSLGEEVLAGGSGGGFPWLREHLVSGYTPQWYHPFADGTTDASILVSGESRWYNYYIEGLAWLVRNVKIDGLYLDDVTYDRRILKRMRKVMERNRPGCMIDLHSNTGFSVGPANQYAEFFPYVDRLWFGEGFRYNEEGPDYWLVEVSGIPFGLMGDMLEGGGNRWRGMVYGMTARLPWVSETNRADPRPVWKLWDEFGIAEAKMLGYWDAKCPVRTDHADLLATAYVKKGRTLIALASWADNPVQVRLHFDWKALGLDAGKAALRAPAVQDFQEARQFAVTDPIEVQPGKGWLLILEEASQ